MAMSAVGQARVLNASAVNVNVRCYWWSQPVDATLYLKQKRWSEINCGRKRIFPPSICLTVFGLIYLIGMSSSKYFARNRCGAGTYRTARGAAGPSCAGRNAGSASRAHVAQGQRRKTR